MFSISKETDYALKALSYLADKNDYISVSEIAEKLKTPKNYLAKIFSKLATVGILRSREGKLGGFILDKSLSDVPLYDFLLFFEEDMSIVSCDHGGSHCDCLNSTCYKRFFKDYLANSLRDQLKDMSLMDVYKYR